MPRRLSRDARREQLVTAAMPIAAEQGLSELSLEDVAARAGVTRNLLYHYFPRGRPDLALAVVEQAGRELTDDWVVDDALSLPERQAANFSRIARHALGPSDAWLIHRHARATAPSALTEVGDRYRERVISSVALNNLGTPDPSPMARLALIGFISLAETVLDEARETGVPGEQVLPLLAETLAATIQAARD